VYGVEDLATAVALYFDQPDLRRAAGRAAYTLVTDNRGALTRTLALMSDALTRAGLDETQARTEVLETGVSR
jgi:hypothetical protein